MNHDYCIKQKVHSILLSKASFEGWPGQKHCPGTQNGKMFGAQAGLRKSNPLVFPVLMINFRLSIRQANSRALSSLSSFSHGYGKFATSKSQVNDRKC